MSTNPVSVPLWDVLSTNSYLVSLLPVEETARYIPGLSDKHQGCALVLRALGCLWLLLHQQGDGTRFLGVNTSTDALKRSDIHWTLYSLLLLELGSTLYEFVQQQITGTDVHTMPPLRTTPDSLVTKRQETAARRREQIRKLLKSVWPLIKLALWVRLFQTGKDDMSSIVTENGSAKTIKKATIGPPLFALYAHRRWLHEQGMELLPTIGRPLLQASRETRRWLQSLWLQLAQSSPQAQP